MEAPVVIVGLGQLGCVFAEGVLRLGRGVVPVVRGQSIALACQEAPEAAGVWLTVGENDLHEVLSQVPSSHLDRVALVQNELRPDQWAFRYPRERMPSVAVVWFEKKANRLPQIVQPTPVFGRGAGLLVAALSKLGLEPKTPENPLDKAELHFQLALKNLYILGLNLTGLMVGGTAGELLEKHKKLFDALVAELLQLEDALLTDAGYPGLLARSAGLQAALLAAIEADPSHGCAGRSAPQRLKRSAYHAKRLGLSLPILEKLAEANHAAF